MLGAPVLTRDVSAVQMRWLPLWLPPRPDGSEVASMSALAPESEPITANHPFCAPTTPSHLLLRRSVLCRGTCLHSEPPLPVCASWRPALGDRSRSRPTGPR